VVAEIVDHTGKKQG